VPGEGLEFQVTMKDGQTLYVQLPRPSRPAGSPLPARRTQSWLQSPMGFAWLLGLVALAVALAERAGRVLTRDQIMEAVRGRELEAFDRSIDVHIGRIRNAIEADSKEPKRILTVRGVGYVFAKQQD
jgi:hypothetical protein